MHTMSGINYQTTSLDVREKCAIMESHIGALAKKIRDEHAFDGCVLISTCNRTEVYISSQDSVLSPDSILCDALGLELNEACFETRLELDCVNYLFETAAGLHSQILGDGQIITQLGVMLYEARKASATDSVLETLFRTAITAGKRIRTDTTLGQKNATHAEAAIWRLEQELTTLKSCKSLVIGNGVIGRLTAQLLEQKGADVTMTLREYKYKPVQIPQGCKTIPYSKRVEYMDDCDIVLSATTSPHFTIKYEDIQGLAKIPAIFVDLAVPRDIDPKIGEITMLFNVDTLGNSSNISEIPEVREIIETYIDKFYSWLSFKKALVTR